MKLQIHENDRVSFLCDHCGKVLDDTDPGEVFFPDFNWFLDHVEEATAKDCWFLCAGCFAEYQGPGQEWYDDRWKALLKSDLH